MDNSEMLERLHALEKEIHWLKNQLAPAKEKATHLDVLKSGYKTIIANWVLVSFLTALATATYVKYAFDVDYFEAYRNISTTKKLAEFHRRFGDEMLSNFEYESAAEAYKSALALRSDDVDSALSLAKAEVYLPLKDKKFVPNEVIDNKLRHLMSLFPNDERLLMMKGAREWEKGNVEGAMELTRKASELKPNFVPAHVQLGFYEMWAGNIDEAARRYETALRINPEDVLALNNLGFYRKITMDFDEAVRLLDKSVNSSPSLITSLNLGDAYRFRGDIQAAITTHEWAKGIIEDSQTKQEELEDTRFLTRGWIMNYMALEKDDRETVKNVVRVDTFDATKSFLYYSLSFDYAVAQDFRKADEEFNRAIALDPKRDYNDYFLNQIQFMMKHTRMDEKTRAWFAKKESALKGSN